MNEQASDTPAPLDTDPDHRVGVIQHIVLLRLHNNTSEAIRTEVVRRFLALRQSKRGDRIYIHSLTGGAQASPEGAGHAFELCFIVTFSSEGDRNFYLGRPFVGEGVAFDEVHDRFKAFLAPLLAPGGLLVFDFKQAGTE